MSRVVSWNVNGLRACTKKGFLDVLNGHQIDVLGVQEVRAFVPQLAPEVAEPDGWHAYFCAAERAGYSGVGIFSRRPADAIETELGIPEFDAEGRFILARFGRSYVVNVYFPKGSGKDRDNSRVAYKLAFYAAVFERIERARRSGPVLVLGDYNTAHQEIDLARPKTNKKSSGFLPEERAVLDDWCSAGWSDTFRAQNPALEGAYSWWRQWGNARADNVGWRIDYLFASPSAQRKVVDAFIWPNVLGSDHCPVGVDIDLPALGARA